MDKKGAAMEFDSRIDVVSEVVVCTYSPENSVSARDDIEISIPQCQESDDSKSPASVHMSDEIIIQSNSLKIKKEIDNGIRSPCNKNVFQENTVGSSFFKTDKNKYDTCSPTSKLRSKNLASSALFSENVSVGKASNSVSECVSEVISRKISETISCEKDATIISVRKCVQEENTVNTNCVSVTDDVNISKSAANVIDGMDISASECVSKESTICTNLSDSDDKVRDDTNSLKSATLPRNDSNTVDKFLSKKSAVSAIYKNILESISSTNTSECSVNQDDIDTSSSAHISEEITEDTDISVSVKDGPNITCSEVVSDNTEIANNLTSNTNTSKSSTSIEGDMDTSSSTCISRETTENRNISKSTVIAANTNIVVENAASMTDDTDTSFSSWISPKLIEDVNSSMTQSGSLTDTNMSEYASSLRDNTDTSFSACSSAENTIDTPNLTEAEIVKLKINREVIKFTTLLKLKELDKLDVIKWFIDIGLLGSEYTCPNCGQKMGLKSRKDSKDGAMWRCKGSGSTRHRMNRSVRAGTIFFDSRMGLIDTMIFIHCWLYKIPTEWTYLEMSISNQTFSTWSNMCRDVCLEMCARDNKKIGGNGTIVEISAEQYEKKRYGKSETVWVFSGVEDIYTGKYFFRIAEECNKYSFFDVIESAVLPGTKVVSEYCSGYSCYEDEYFISLDSMQGYTFDAPNNIPNYKSKTWDNWQKHLPKHKKPFGFDNHITEYVWRKRNSSAIDKMRNFIVAMKTVYPPRIKDETKK